MVSLSINSKLEQFDKFNVDLSYHNYKKTIFLNRIMSKLKYKHILSFHKKQPVQMYKLFLFKKLRLAMTNRIQYLFLLRLIALYRYFRRMQNLKCFPLFYDFSITHNSNGITNRLCQSNVMCYQ